MNIVTPIAITAEMIAAGTSVTEPAATETAWVSEGTYSLGDQRIRATTHRVYECVQAHTGRKALPENDAAYWLDKGPTQQWAPFDIYTNTAAKATTSITYVLTPGYFNAVALYGLVGTGISVKVKDAPGGAQIYSYVVPLMEDPAGWWEYLFLRPRPITKLLLTGIPIRPNAELTVTVTAAAGQQVGIGMINVGDYRSLLGEAEWGGTQYGASAEPISYSYIKTNPDGTTSIVRRTAATSMRASVIMPREFADYALSCVQEVLDVPVSWIAVNAAGYAGLNVFGLGSASLTYDSFGHATLNITVKGMI
ncbi:hypothetical protein GTP44_00975 [Duganella sp. FT50W]|uniref:Carbohydrate-binding protein n=1 Tax=Duganella lactea TaxID=2692173 RepID=A0A6L8MFI7_9BURK|nr:hypothetical protein [Duganella lactea]MYM80532.1 hypothetical protein [Duganella lactea]